MLEAQRKICIGTAEMTALLSNDDVTYVSDTKHDGVLLDMFFFSYVCTNWILSTVKFAIVYDERD